jgi:hypothetical protein
VHIYACVCISACTYCWPEQINLKLPDLTLTVEIILGSELTHEHANLKLKKINKYRRRRRRRRRRRKTSSLKTEVAYLIELRKEPQVIHPKLLHSH